MHSSEETARYRLSWTDVVTTPLLLKLVQEGGFVPQDWSRSDSVSTASRRPMTRRGADWRTCEMIFNMENRRMRARAVSVTTTDRTGERLPWTSTLNHLPTVSTVFGHALERKATEAARQSELVELQSRGRTTEHEVLYRPEVGVACGSGLMASESPKIREILTQVELVAPTSATVLLLGETGAGKEVFAQAIHDISPRRHRQMIRVSCAAIPSALVESELFGCERGAFTDAITRRIGRFEAASQSTLFLDEIGDLPANAQVKLLRVLQDHVIERLGSTHPIKIDIRIIVATNRNLDDAVADKSFREDLFYRLNVFPIVVPPLRERPEDIAGLVWQFVDEFGQSFNKPIASISKESMRALRCYSWPGNVRELRNVIERAVIMSSSPRLTPQVPRHPPLEKSRATMTLAQVEAEHIRATLESTNWRIRGQGGAAERLALKPTTLESRLVKLGIERPQPSPYESRRL